MTFNNFSLIAFSCLLGFAGCSGETPEGAKQPQAASIEATVAEIVALRNVIRDGFASGDVDAAHGPLHDVGDKLETLSKLTVNTSLPAEDKQAIEEHINTLFAAFGEVDKTLHGQEGSTYDEEASTIDEAIDRLVHVCKTND